MLTLSAEQSSIGTAKTAVSDEEERIRASRLISEFAQTLITQAARCLPSGLFSFDERRSTASCSGEDGQQKSVQSAGTGSHVH